MARERDFQESVYRRVAIFLVVVWACALRLAAQDGPWEGADRLNHQASELWVAKDLDAALEKYEAAEAAYEEEGDPRQQGNMASMQGVLLRQLNRHGEADARYERAVAILSAHLAELEKGSVDYQNVLRNLAMAYGGILDREIRLGRLEAAEKLAQEQLGRSEELADDYAGGRAWDWQRLGKIASLAGKKELAARRYRESMKLWKEAGVPDYAANVEKELAALADVDLTALAAEPDPVAEVAEEETPPPAPQSGAEAEADEAREIASEPEPLFYSPEEETPSESAPAAAAAEPRATQPPENGDVPPMLFGSRRLSVVAIAFVGFLLLVGIARFLSALRLRAQNPEARARAAKSSVQEVRGPGVAGCALLLLVTLALFAVYFFRGTLF